MNLRIVGGVLSGRRFPGPAGDSVRPTGERVREAVASALDARGAIAGARVLDLFAGTGALGFEMLSRGARGALFVDRSRKNLQAIKQAASVLGLEDASVLALDLLTAPPNVARQFPVGERFPGGEPFGLVLLDPPYAEAAKVPALVSALLEGGVIGSDAHIVFEHGKRHEPELPPTLRIEATYRYGDTTVTLWRPASAP